MELKDLKNFVNLLLNEASNNIVYNLINLIKGCFTKTDYLNKYIDKIKKNDLNFTRIKDIYGEKDVISKLVSCFSINDALNLLKIVINVKESNLYRKELILHLFQLFKKLSKEERKDYFNVTERYFSNVQRKNFQNNISHVLLIKGLEFDNCLVVITKDRNGKIEFSEKELYVALSRAKNKLIILY